MERYQAPPLRPLSQERLDALYMRKLVVFQQVLSSNPHIIKDPSVIEISNDQSTA